MRHITVEDILQLEKVYYWMPQQVVNIDLPSNPYHLYIKLYLTTKRSASNNWIDPDGSIYIKYSETQAAKYLHCTRVTAKKAFTYLAEQNLIEIIDNGRHKVDKIYLLIDK